MIFQIAQKVRDTSPVIGTLALLEFRFDLDISQNFLHCDNNSNHEALTTSFQTLDHFTIFHTPTWDEDATFIFIKL